jgi:hypothetical protein
MASSSTLTPDSRVERKADVPWKRLEDSVMILDLASGDFFELDELGSRIWRDLDGARTLAEQARVIADEYGVALETACSDVIEFVTELDAKGLVTRIG